jgi:hypothetical protein
MEYAIISTILSLKLNLNAKTEFNGIRFLILKIQR